MYVVKVKRVGLGMALSFTRRFKAKGHAVTNAFAQHAVGPDGKPQLVNMNGGPMRLEIFLEDGGVVIYGDISKIRYTLGQDWFNQHAKQAEAESGGLVKLAK